MMVELFLRERACAKDLRSEWAFSAIDVGLCCKIKLVKDVDLVGDNNDETLNEDGLMHDIVSISKQEGSHHGWFGTNRIVCANLYDTSVRAAKDLFRKGLRFIAGVKTATKGFPKTSHSSLELHSHSDFISLISEPATSNESDPTMASFMWMGHKSKVFYCDCWNSIHLSFSLATGS
jgi:hypothetical protein